ncbi:MAG: hypothetical protein VXV91_01900, partial [Verrucomicrobiota bacterium]|nr:hypothetical protein [Verrucomicrobiota bacterium]
QRGPFSDENRARYLFQRAVERTSNVRPLRTQRNTKRDKLTVDEREFLHRAQQGDWPIVWAPNPKSGKSRTRYDRYSKSSTIRQAYEIMGKKGKSQMWMDLKNDFLKGHIDFPGHTSIESAEVTDARRLASFAGVPLLPGLFEFDSYGPLGELDTHADSGLTDEDIVAMALNKDYNLVNAMSMLHNDVEIDTTTPSSNTEAPAGENQHSRSQSRSQLKALTRSRNPSTASTRTKRTYSRRINQSFLRKSAKDGGVLS